MTLQSSGAISLADVQTEFGGSNPIAISEYYGVGTVPSSGVISLDDFYGESAFTATHTLTVGNFIDTYGFNAFLAFGAINPTSVSAIPFGSSGAVVINVLEPNNVTLQVNGDFTSKDCYIETANGSGTDTTGTFVISVTRWDIPSEAIYNDILDANGSTLDMILTLT